MRSPARGPPPIGHPESAAGSTLLFRKIYDECRPAPDARLCYRCNSNPSPMSNRFDASIDTKPYTGHTFRRNVFGQAQLFIRKTPARDRQEKAERAERGSQARSARYREIGPGYRQRLRLHQLPVARGQSASRRAAPPGPTRRVLSIPPWAHSVGRCRLVTVSRAPPQSTMCQPLDRFLTRTQQQDA